MEPTTRFGQWVFLLFPEWSDNGKFSNEIHSAEGLPDSSPVQQGYLVFRIIEFNLPVVAVGIQRVGGRDSFYGATAFVA